MNIGFIAHESKKKLLQNFCIAYRGILSKHQLYATGTSGRLIEEATNLDVHKLHAGHVGGEQQMASILCGPYQEKKHEPDAHKIFRLCDTHIIPLATNLATAELLIKSLERGELDWREMYKK